MLQSARSFALLGSLLIVGLAGQAPPDAAPAPSAAIGGWWGELFQEEVVAFERIIAHPEGFRGARVAFLVQFHRFGQLDNPFHTRFDKHYYVNFSAWPEGAPLWERDTYRSDFPFLFIRRSRDEAKVLANAGTYSRWLVQGEVTDIIQGKPWIDVSAMKRLSNELDEASLVQLVQADKLKELGQFEGAAKAYRAADHDKLPAWVRVYAMASEARALVREGKNAEALERARAALALIPEDRGLQRLVQEITALPQRTAPVPATPPAPGPTPSGETGG